MIIWKRIVIEGLNTMYSVSSNGEVRNDNTGRILKQHSSNEYCKVSLSINGVMKNFSVHRLVAQAFIENPEHKKIVNHIDGVRYHNNVENLEWCTASENALHAHNTGLIGHQKKRGVRQFNLAGEWLMDFESQADAAQQTGCLAEKICEVCQGNRRTAGNYQWRYLDSNIKKLDPVPLPSCTKKKVAQYTKDGEFIAEYESYKAAARAVNGTSSAISRICSGTPGLHTHKGFVWKIVDDIVQEEIDE